MTDEKLLTTEELENLKNLLNENSDLLPRLDTIIDLIVKDLNGKQVPLDPTITEAITLWKADYLALKVKCHMFNQGYSLH